MIGLRLSAPANRPLRVLCLGAHADDIEIGCGGTIAKLIAAESDISVKWVVFSGSDQRRDEALRSANAYLQDTVQSDAVVAEFTDGHFPFEGSDIKKFFERELKSFEPDLVFTHDRFDRHQDHRVLSDLTWQTFRHQFILEYEIPKFDGDLGQPNFYVELSDQEAATKIDRLQECFGSQDGKHWFDETTFRALMRIRAVECAAVSGAAEAFYVRKAVLAGPA